MDGGELAPRSEANPRGTQDGPSEPRPLDGDAGMGDPPAIVIDAREGRSGMAHQIEIGGRLLDSASALRGFGVMCCRDPLLAVRAVSVLAEETARRGRSSAALDRDAVRVLIRDATAGAQELAGILSRLAGHRHGRRTEDHVQEPRSHS
jgi:hypothetical protein